MLYKIINNKQNCEKKYCLLIKVLTLCRETKMMTCIKLFIFSLIAVLPIIEFSLEIFEQ